MKITKLKEVLEVVVSHYICNKCGKDIIDKNLAHEVGMNFYYGSNFDMESWNFDLCEECIMELIKSFKVVPEGFRVDPTYTRQYDEDHEIHQQLFNEWKETGVWGKKG